MTPEAQRIAIAEACGWVRGEKGTFLHDYWTHPTDSNAAHSFYDDGFPLPDYLNDLNVIAEAENTLLHGNAHESAVTELERTQRDHLAKILGCAWYQSARIIRANAAQRSRALILTLNLWDNTK